jgi:hypothetical protein
LGRLRDLAKLVIAIERHALLIARRPTTGRRSPSSLLTDRQAGSPPKFDDDPDILERYPLDPQRRMQC